jgi:hypothetical protein
MRWLAVEPSRIGQFFIPMLCREYPKASKIQVEFIVNAIPALEKVITLKNENYDELVKSEEISRMVYDCAT